MSRQYLQWQLSALGEIALVCLSPFSFLLSLTLPLSSLFPLNSYHSCSLGYFHFFLLCICALLTRHLHRHLDLATGFCAVQLFSILQLL